MRKPDLILTAVGIAFLAVGIIAAERAPHGAKKDVDSYMQQPYKVTGSKGLFLSDKFGFYEAHLAKRFIVSGLIGLSGCGLLILGAKRLTDRCPPNKSIE